MADVTQRPERLTLSRDFSELLVELSIALHKYAIYPNEHPSLQPAAAAVADRAGRLLEDRPLVAVGIARHQLIIEGVATDPGQPVLRRLAESLHRHHLGAISFRHGVGADEIGGALRALAADAVRDGPLGLLAADRRPSWPHLQLHPLTFDGLTLVGDADMAAEAPGGRGARSAELWIGLARAAMAGETGRPADRPVPTEPTVVARAIDEHPQAEAYDQVIVGYLLQIATELRQAAGSEGAALRRRTARLIAALRPETLRRLVAMSGQADQRHAFLLDASHGLAVEAVLKVVNAAADATGQTISHGLVRMLSKLAAHAERGGPRARPLAESALREQVERLLEDWRLEDPNPEAYSRLLQHVASTRQGWRPTLDEEAQAEQSDPLRVAQMGLEVGLAGPLVDRAVDEAVGQGSLAAVLTLLASRPAGADAAAGSILARLAAPHNIAALVMREPVDFDSLDRLLPTLSVEAYGVLLDALASSESRGTRRRLLDRLASAEPDIRSMVLDRLEDDRWYVQRNMLVLLGRLGSPGEGFSVARWTGHPDARVRTEALRIQLASPERESALRTALADADPRVIRVGLAALPRGYPDDLVPLVTAVSATDALPEPIRVLAVTALSSSRSADALESLLALADGGRSLLGRPRLAPRSPVSLAALRALATGWPRHPRAATLLTLAAESADPELRAIGALGRS